MSTKKTDISQIRKYLAGELDARAMHQLEREAMDDPFLMDAIEGYSSHHTDQQAQLEELQSKLEHRVSKRKVYRMPSRLMIAAAASVLIILSVAYLLWPSGRQIPVKQMAVTIPKTPAPAIVHDTLLKPADDQQQLAANTAESATERQPTRHEELSQAAPADVSVSMMAATAPTVITEVKKTDTAAHAPAAHQPKPNDSLNTTMALAASKQPAMAGTNNVTGAEPVRMMKAAVMAKSVTKISGMVSDETGQPLAGVSIAEKGKTDGVKTDDKGKFSLPGENGELLSITHPGYDSKEVKGDIHDSLNVILRSADKSISEIVAIGFGQSLMTQRIKEAHPQIGWDKYNAYLKARAFVSEGKAGTVRLSFTVDNKGVLGNFKISKSLFPAADELAINIVKEGPQWAPDVNRATKTISLKIDFKLQP